MEESRGEAQQPRRKGKGGKFQKRTANKPTKGETPEQEPRSICVSRGTREKNEAMEASRKDGWGDDRRRGLRTNRFCSVNCYLIICLISNRQTKIKILQLVKLNVRKNEFLLDPRP